LRFKFHFEINDLPLRLMQSEVEGVSELQEIGSKSFFSELQMRPWLRKDLEERNPSLSVSAMI